MFSKLFGNFIAFVYHCFDRIVIHGYLSGLSRPEQVVHFFRRIVGVPVLSKEILSERTANYQNWVEAFARNHRVPIEWAEKGVRKEDYVLRWLRRMIRTNRYGVYFIFKSMEQGTTFRISVPKYPTADPNYRILAHQRSRFTHYYFYIRDEVLGPMVMRVASFFPFQTTYYLNGHSFIEQELNRAQVGFRKHDNAFLAIDDVAALQAAADRLSPPIIRKRLDYWTFLLGPKFSAKERKQINLSRFYAISQIEYCRNFIFKRNFPIHKLFERSCELGVPTANPKQLTDARESVDSPIDERSLQIDLVRPDQAVPVACRIRSRNPCPSASAQRAAAQSPEASGPQQQRPAIACWALSPGSRGAGRCEDHNTGDAAPLAPCRLPSLLALEIPTARWSTAGTGRHSSSHSRDECR